MYQRQPVLAAFVRLASWPQPAWMSIPRRMRMVQGMPALFSIVAEGLGALAGGGLPGVFLGRVERNDIDMADQTL